MSSPPATDLLASLTEGIPPRPLAPALRTARADVVAAARALATIRDDRLVQPWPWIGGSEEELRYGFYRIAESFDLAAIEAADALRAATVERGRAADLIALATAARWQLKGVLETVSDTDFAADPGGGEWSIRQTVGHMISSQRGYSVGTAWWISQGYAANDPALPSQVPDELWHHLPSEEDDGLGSAAEVRDRFDSLLDRSAERLAGLDPARLAIGGRWSGFAVDVAFRLGRWSSHIREHTIQVEKTLVLLGREPSEVQRLVRNVLAAWGRAEAAVFGAPAAGDAVAVLADAASVARATAAELVATAAG
ncbi:MAG: DinB family protein [Chloroflexota bacterium]